MSSENIAKSAENTVVRIPPNRQSKVNFWLGSVLLNTLVYLFLIPFGAADALVALISVLLLTGTFSYSLYRFLDMIHAWATTALLANEHGVVDSTGTLPGGLVRWEEISGISESDIHGEPVLLLHLHNTQTYLDRIPEPKRSLLAASVPRYGTPCVVAQSDIGLPIADAGRLLEDARLQYIRIPIAQTGISQSPVAVATAPVAHWWTAVPPEERTVQPLRNGSSDR